MELVKPRRLGLSLGLLLGFLSLACCEEPEPAKRRTLVDRLLFFPSQHPQGQWQPSGLTFQDVHFRSADGTKLHGWYCLCERPRGVVLIAHGNAGHVASRASWLRLLQTQAGLTAFMFDYRGYGKSEGKPTVAGVLADARAARSKLRELAGVEDGEMLLMGESLGGAVMVQLAAEAAPRALILQSTFSSLRDVAREHYPRLSWLAPRDQLASLNVIGKYRGPLLQSHGSNDNTIPLALGRRLFKAANDPKVFVEIRNADHNNWLTREYLARFQQFIANLPPTKHAAKSTPPRAPK